MDNVVDVVAIGVAGGTLGEASDLIFSLEFNGFLLQLLQLLLLLLLLLLACGRAGYKNGGIQVTVCSQARLVKSLSDMTVKIF